MTSGPSIAGRLLAIDLARVGAEDDAADGRDEQHDRGDLEGEQVVGEEQPSDLGGAAEASAAPRVVREPVAGLEADARR